MSAPGRRNPPLRTGAPQTGAAGVTERLYLYDTALRDGQQTQGVRFSVGEKRRIARLLGGLGVDYIEGGWPGANPTDSAFFDEPPEVRPTLAASGMTERAGRTGENAVALAAAPNAPTRANTIAANSKALLHAIAWKLLRILPAQVPSAPVALS